jgi:hypothetical protein
MSTTGYGEEISQRAFLVHIILITEIPLYSRAGLGRQMQTLYGVGNGVRADVRVAPMPSVRPSQIVAGIDSYSGRGETKSARG